MKKIVKTGDFIIYDIGDGYYITVISWFDDEYYYNFQLSHEDSEIIIDLPIAISNYYPGEIDMLDVEKLIPNLNMYKCELHSMTNKFHM